MLDEQTILAVVLNAARKAAAIQMQKPDENISGATVLLGSASVLDSIAFVMLIADIERTLSEKHGVSILIVNERAMSMRHSPFRTVSTLSDYIGKEIAAMRKGQDVPDGN